MAQQSTVFSTSSLYDSILTVLKRHSPTPGSLVEVTDDLIHEILCEAGLDLNNLNNLAKHGTREQGFYLTPLVDTSLAGRGNTNSLIRRVQIAYAQLGKRKNARVSRGNRKYWGLSDGGLSTPKFEAPVIKKVKLPKITTPDVNRVLAHYSMPSAPSGERNPRLPADGSVFKVTKQNQAGEDVVVSITIEAGQVRYAGDLYPSVSAAATACANALGAANKAINGWTYWGIEKRGTTKVTKAAVVAAVVAVVAPVAPVAPVVVAKPRPAKNATARFLDQRLSARGSKLLETMRNAVMKKLPLSAATGQIEDHVQNCLMQIIARDALKGRLDSGAPILDHHIANWAVRSAYKDIRNAGTEPVTRELHGARTERERIKKIALGDLNDSRVQWNKGEDGGDGTWTDIEDTESSLSARSTEDMLDFEMTWGQIESLIMTHRPQAGKRYLDILRMRADGLSVKEIAEAENVSPYRATSLVAEARNAIQEVLSTKVIQPPPRRKNRLMPVAAED